MSVFEGILFDLDGTLLDTAPDLIYALNLLRRENKLPDLPLSALRHIANLGSKALVKYGFNIEEDHPQFIELRGKFLDVYQMHVADTTQFFPQADHVLNHLDEQQIPWGIVTNKPTRHTQDLLKLLNLSHRPLCVICGDTLSTYKPDPAPLLHACELIKVDPKNCLYIGDSATDVIASKAAGTKSLVALYGYIQEEEKPETWLADGYIKNPIEIIDWIYEYRLI